MKRGHPHNAKQNSRNPTCFICVFFSDKPTSKVRTLLLLNGITMLKRILIYLKYTVVIYKGG